MRFRQKSGPLVWGYLLLMCFYACDFIFSIFWHSPSTSSTSLVFHGVIAAGWACAALFLFLSRRSAYWDLDSDGLHQRQFGSKTELTIPWEKVLAVRNLIPGFSWDGTVSVYYEFPASKLGFKHIVAVPQRRKELIEALRGYAPQATFTA
jgi:hypothetical protein